MKRTTVTGLAALAVLAAGPALAQSDPAVAMGNLYQATAQALANAAHNATSSQQQSSVTDQAATTQGVATLYSIDTASTGVLAADPRSRAVLDRELPGLTDHPSFPAIRRLTLPQIAPTSAGLLTPAKLTAIQAGLSAIR